MRSLDKTKSISRKIALAGILSAMALVIGYAENLIPPLFSAAPGIKIGLSNILILFALEYVDMYTAISISIIKSLFVIITRGVLAGLFSIGGGLLSIFAMALIYKLLSDRISYIGVSIIGSTVHNIGQLAVACILISSTIVVLLLPILIVSGVIMGTIIGIIYKITSRRLRNAFRFCFKGEG